MLAPYAGTLIGGGFGGAFIENYFKSKQKHSDVLFNKRSPVYTQLFSSLKYTKLDNAEFRGKVQCLITDALLLTAEPRVKDLLERIRREIFNGSYWSKRGSKIGRRELSELEELLQKELGVKITLYRKLCYKFSRKKFVGLRNEDDCTCGSGKKFKFCHAKNRKKKKL